MSGRFINTLSAPPGGKFFYELNGDRVEARSYQEMITRVRNLMARHGVDGSAEVALSEYMCPRLGPASSYFCEGDFDHKETITSHEALSNTEPYFRGPVETFDVIEKRLTQCLGCPKHYRAWCLTCTGHYDRIIAGFGGKRPKVPVDRGTGVCMCARAYEAAIASLVYDKDSAKWKDLPDTCWRNNDV